MCSHDKSATCAYADPVKSSKLRQFHIDIDMQAFCAAALVNKSLIYLVLTCSDCHASGVLIAVPDSLEDE